MPLNVPSTALHERYAELVAATQQLPDGAPLETVVHLAHEISHFQMDVGRELAAAGAGTPPARGLVDRVNVSGGGVPKLPTGGGGIGHAGLEGDRQADRKHHGRPFQALCLWSAEVIDELAAAGHPIGPGSAGENLTLSGIDWTALRPGARLRVGTALAELSFPAVPCAQAGPLVHRRRLPPYRPRKQPAVGALVCLGARARPGGPRRRSRRSAVRSHAFHAQ